MSHSKGHPASDSTTKASRRATSRVSGASVARARSMKTTRSLGMKGLSIRANKKKKKKY